MKLYIKQKVFSFSDSFNVYDQWGKVVYTVQGKMFSIGKKLYVFDTFEREVAYIEQKVLSFLPKYFVYVNGNQVAEIIKHFTFFTHKYSVAGLGWDVNGDFLAHDYQITQNGNYIASIKKQWLSFGDCYEIDIDEHGDTTVALAVVLAIDCVLANNNN